LFFDKEIKKSFLKNFKFENRLIVTKKYEINDDIFSWFFDNQNNSEYPEYKLNGSFKKISSDIEVYVRKN